MDIVNINATQNALLIHWEYKENAWIYLTNEIRMQMTPFLCCYVQKPNKAFTKLKTKYVHYVGKHSQTQRSLKESRAIKISLGNL
jgi:hypothetical protein